MNARDRLLGSLSENTRVLYEKVFDMFWEFAESRYSPPRGVDPYDWLVDHRRAEVTRHCERVVSEWYASLTRSDLDRSSIVTYIAVIRSFFKHLLPRGVGSLHLPLEPSDGGLDTTEYFVYFCEGKFLKRTVGVSLLPVDMA